MRLTRNLGIPLILTLTATSPALAQEDRYIDIMPFLTRVDEDRNTERQAVGLRGTFGFRSDENWFTEIQLFGAKLDEDDNLPFPDQMPLNPDIIDTDLSGDVELSGLGMDVVYSFNDRKGYSPFVLAGFGASHNNTKISDDNRDTNGFFNIGAGFTSNPIAENGLKIRAEVRYLRDYFASDMNDWQFGIGFSIPLSCPPAPVRVAAAPPPAPKPEVIETDSDGDGVLDRNDRCPDTLPGAEVDEYGCVVEAQTVTLDNIQFEFNSAKLTASAESSLNRVVQALQSQPDSQVEVAGHTDSQGNDAYNMRLSKQRADSVRSYLVRNGIDGARISARGYGETQPVASNATKAGRATNRRVEMRFQ